jgi:cob(I)alamin adenosyltransferase
MARIYTRTGDAGETSLFDGTRTSKADPRVDLYGDVDELNSVLGCAVAALAADAGSGGGQLAEELRGIQRALMEMGSVLADPARSAALDGDPAAPELLPVARLEAWIDGHEAVLAPLRSFILPGGTPAAALLHLARTVCRRVERRAVEAAAATAVPAAVRVYLNRLSDYLFVVARRANQLAGAPDVVWRAGRSQEEEPAP